MRKNIIITAILITAFAATLLAQNVEVKKFKMTIAGTSTLHDWESTATEMKLKGQFQFNGTLTGIEKLEVQVPVKGIKSTKGSKMDKKTWDALEAEDHPFITYKLQKLESIVNKADHSELKATGLLTVAGVGKAISMTVSSQILPDGQIKLTGSKEMKMTDHNIEPPTALFGTIKTGDDITIGFELILSVQNQ